MRTSKTLFIEWVDLPKYLKDEIIDRKENFRNDSAYDLYIDTPIWRFKNLDDIREHTIEDWGMAKSEVDTTEKLLDVLGSEGFDLWLWKVIQHYGDDCPDLKDVEDCVVTVCW